MGQINKGTIASIDGTTARVVPSDASAKPTAKIIIPWHLRGDTGNLSKGTEVVYAEFDDATGLLLGRADGEWGEYLPNLSVDTMKASEGITAETVTATGEVAAGSVSTDGQVIAGSVKATNGVDAKTVTATGNVKAGSVSTDGQVSAGSVKASEGVNAKTVTATGKVTADSVEASGDVKAGSVSLKNHKHSGVTTGEDTTGVPQ